MGSSHLGRDWSLDPGLGRAVEEAPDAFGVRGVGQGTHLGAGVGGSAHTQRENRPD